MNFDDREERDVLAGEYVLGLLSPEDRRVFERELASNRELASSVAFWQDRLLEMAPPPEPVAPSPDLWRRIVRDLRDEAPAGAGWDRLTEADATQADATAVGRPGTDATGGSATGASAMGGSATGARAARAGLWSSLRFWRLAGLASGVAAVVLAWSLFFAVPQPVAFIPQYVAVLQSATDKTPDWLVEVSADRAVRLTPLTRPAVGPRQALELWTKPPGASAPVSMGLVAAERSTFVPAAKLPGITPNQFFAISLEPETGSPTGSPTGPVLATGESVQL